MQVNKHCRDRYFVYFHIVNTLFINLTDPDRMKKASRSSAPTDEDDEERMTMEFNNRYTFKL